MGRATSGVAGMKLRKGDEVIAIEVARDESDLLVVTDNGYGKRTRVEEYPRKGRGTMGVLTIRLVESRGKLAGAMVVRDSQQVMLIPQTARRRGRASRASRAWAATRRASRSCACATATGSARWRWSRSSPTSWRTATSGRRTVEGASEAPAAPFAPRPRRPTSMSRTTVDRGSAARRTAE